MSDSAVDLARDEFRELRATIRQRGSLRVVLFVATLLAWGAMVVTLTATIELPLASLVPLLGLVAGFEAMAALHIGVERIGRYVQVRFERDLAEPDAAGSAPSLIAPDAPAWERTAMAWGRQFPGNGTDPLFTTVFVLATILNYGPVVLTGAPPELAWIGAVHVLFIARLYRVRAYASRQRAEDLGRYRTLLGGN